MTWIKYCGTQPVDVGLVLEYENDIGPEKADRKFDKVDDRNPTRPKGY
jgi:hypothetical protein